MQKTKTNPMEESAFIMSFRLPNRAHSKGSKLN